MTDTQYFIFVIAIFAIFIPIIIKIYTYSKASWLRELGYDIVYHYLNNCRNMSYYRDNKNHLSHVHKSTYDTLVKNKDEWYLNGTSRRIIMKILEFYDKATDLTDDAARYLSLSNYFSFSECQYINKKAKEVEILMDAVNTFEYKCYIRNKWEHLNRQGFI